MLVDVGPGPGPLVPQPRRLSRIPLPATRVSVVVLAVTALLGAVATPAAVRAHGLVLNVAPHGGELVGQATYSDGTPARGERATVVSLDAPGEAPRRAVTDGLGQFRVAPAAPGRQRVVVEGVEGHRASVQITVPRAVAAAPATAQAAGAGDAATALVALREEIAALRGEVVRLNARTRAGDLMAGVGLIAAIAGLAAFWLSRRGP